MAGHRAPRTAKGHDPLGLGSAPMRPWVGDEGYIQTGRVVVGEMMKRGTPGGK